MRSYQNEQLQNVDTYTWKSLFKLEKVNYFGLKGIYTRMHVEKLPVREKRLWSQTY